MKNVLILAIILFVLSSCRDEVISPGSADDNLISNSSFELNGNATLRGWNPYGQVEFFRDTPPDGGKFSVGIREFWGPAYYLSYTLKPDEGAKVYILNCWAKTSGRSGRISLEVRRDSLISSKSIEVKDTLWKSYVIIDTISADRGDSIQVLLYGSISQLLPSTTFFDKCTLRTR